MKLLREVQACPAIMVKVMVSDFVSNSHARTKIFWTWTDTACIWLPLYVLFVHLFTGVNG